MVQLTNFFIILICLRMQTLDFFFVLSFKFIQPLLTNFELVRHLHQKFFKSRYHLLISTFIYLIYLLYPSLTLLIILIGHSLFNFILNTLYLCEKLISYLVSNQCYLNCCLLSDLILKILFQIADLQSCIVNAMSQIIYFVKILTLLQLQSIYLLNHSL